MLEQASAALALSGLAAPGLTRVNRGPAGPSRAPDTIEGLPEVSAARPTLPPCDPCEEPRLSSESRVLHAGLRQKIMSADRAAALIRHGDHVGMSGFTGAGYPKAVPAALAAHIAQVNADGEHFRIGVWTGASTAPELDGALAKVGGIEMRLPYQSDPTCRARINAGEMEYIDIHLSHEIGRAHV